MRKFLPLLFLFLIPALVKAEILVNPSSLTITTKPNTNFRKYFNVTNTGNETTVYVSKQGIVANWCTVEPSVLTIPANQTRSFYCQFVIPDVTGTFQGALVVDTKSVPITITVQKPQEVENVTQESGEFHFLTTTYGVSVQRGYKFIKTFYLRNDMNVRVEVKDFMFSGSGYVVTPEGGKPVRIEAWELGYLDPGDEKMIDVTIDGSLEPGTYKVILEVYGLTPSKRKVTASLSFTINVVEKPSPIPTVKLVCPKEVYEGDEFTIYLENIKPETRIFYSIPLEGKVTRTDTRWEFKASGTKGVYNATLLLLQGDSFETKTCSFEIKEKPRPKVLIVEWKISNSTLSLVAKDRDSGEVLEDALIKVDGNTYTEPIKVAPGKTYLITATYDEYEPFSREIKVPLRMMSIRISPSRPKPGDYVNVSVVSGAKVVPASVTVNGEPYTEPFRVEAGKSYVIVAKAEGYKEAKLTLRIPKPKGFMQSVYNFVSAYWWTPLAILPLFLGFKLLTKRKVPRTVYVPTERGPAERIKRKYEEEGGE